MPFVSKRQQRKCYALAGKGKNKSWDCAEFSAHTDFAALPEVKHSEEDTKTAEALLKFAAGAVNGAPSMVPPIKPFKPLTGLFQPPPPANSPQNAASRPANTRPDGQPAVRTVQERTAKPAQASMGDGPLTSGQYGAYGMRTPWLNGIAPPPTVANGGGALKMANKLGACAAKTVRKQHRLIKGKDGRFVFQGRSATNLKDDPNYMQHVRQ